MNKLDQSSTSSSTSTAVAALPHPVETARVLDTRDPFTLGIQFAPEHYLELKCVDPSPILPSAGHGRHFKTSLQEFVTGSSLPSELAAAARGPLGGRPSHDAVMQRKRLLRYSRRRLKAMSATLLNRDRDPQTFRSGFVNLHHAWSSHQRELSRMLEAQRHSLRDLVSHVRTSLHQRNNPIAHASSQRSNRPAEPPGPSRSSQQRVENSAPATATAIAPAPPGGPSSSPAATAAGSPLDPSVPTVIPSAPQPQGQPKQKVALVRRFGVYEVFRTVEGPPSLVIRATFNMRNQAPEQSETKGAAEPAAVVSSSNSGAASVASTGSEQKSAGGTEAKTEAPRKQYTRCCFSVRVPSSGKDMRFVVFYPSASRLLVAVKSFTTGLVASQNFSVEPFQNVPIYGANAPNAPPRVPLPPPPSTSTISAGSSSSSAPASSPSPAPTTSTEPTTTPETPADSIASSPPSSPRSHTDCMTDSAGASAQGAVAGSAVGAPPRRDPI